MNSLMHFKVSEIFSNIKKKIPLLKYINKPGINNVFFGFPSIVPKYI